MQADWSGVLLDLLNTTPVVDGTPTDALADDVATRAWLRTRGGDGSQDLDRVREVRADLQRVVRRDANANVLNRYLATVRQTPAIGDDGLRWTLAESTDWPARVVLAWGELQNDKPGRLRACANDECQLFLVDRTRAGTARWCSMSGCGNRMKARRHYHRTAGRTAD